jgi:hypothetical protein
MMVLRLFSARDITLFHHYTINERKTKDKVVSILSAQRRRKESTQL